MKTGQMLNTDFWKSVSLMNREDKLFYLYLLTNSCTNHIGIYQITKKQIAFELDYSLDTVTLLMDRFTEQYNLIHYNSTTLELAIKKWGLLIEPIKGKRNMDYLFSELSNVEDPSLISYVSESIAQPEIRSLYESFFETGRLSSSLEE